MDIVDNNGLLFQHRMSKEASKKYELELEKLLKDDIPKITDDQVDKLIEYESLRPCIINVVIDAHIHEKFKLKFELDAMNKNRRRRVKKGKKRK